ncbi:MAG: lysophospholipid acyltransferase family protein [Deltaproteobacteria bacterium]|nr:lysophospholipid acyltransferase family protein [Deltaproteobacteria bacterium]
MRIRAMSTVYSAPRPETALPAQVGRVARLFALLLQMWLAARLAAPQLGEAQRARLMRYWARRFLRTLGVEVQVRGTPPRRDEPTLMVANHVSWLDTYAVHTVEAARFVAKSEVATWPIIGIIAQRFGTVFIQRRSCRAAARTVGALAQLLCQGRSVAVFPEATTSDGRGLLPFYPAMFQSAVLTGARVQPVAMRYRDDNGAPTELANFVGEMSVLDSLRNILAAPRLMVEVVFCAPIDPNGMTRRELAAASRGAIAVALGVELAAPEDRPLPRAA